MNDNPWIDGAPPFPQDTEWFIAETIHDERVVLKAAHDRYVTADHTYYSKASVRRWMQFPDCEFKPAKPVAVCEVKLNSYGFRYLDWHAPGGIQNLPAGTQLLAVPYRPSWTHHIRGGSYRVIGDASLQTDTPLRDLDHLIVYQGDNGELWVRPVGEYMARFKREG